MNFIINKNIIESMLISIVSYIEKKDLSQITSHILINLEEAKLIIEATDYEIGLSILTTNVKVKNIGKATANGKKLLDIIKILKDDDIYFEIIKNNLVIKQNKSKFKLPMFNYEEFPSFPNIENKNKLEISSLKLIQNMKKIIPAIDTNNPKYELNGALIDISENSIKLVATDTKRLAILNIENKNKETTKLIVTKKAILEIQKIFFDEIEIFFDNKILIAKSNNFTFFTKLINGNFPEYSRIIPKELKYEIILNKDKMIEAIKQISIISNELKITYNSNNITFESLNEDNIEAKTQIEVNIENLDEEIIMNTHSKHIIDFLANIQSNQFTLGYNDKSLPYILKSNELLTIVLPIMV